MESKRTNFPKFFFETRFSGLPYLAAVSFNFALDYLVAVFFNVLIIRYAQGAQPGPAQPGQL